MGLNYNLTSVYYLLVATLELQPVTPSLCFRSPKCLTSFDTKVLFL